jgi:recombinational DNA repair ATPase RecF
MSHEFRGIELHGVTLVGIPPIGRVHIELDRGVTVLYGLNGAGKTRICNRH